MPQGLQVFDANGDIVIDVTTRLTKYIGKITTTTSNGSVAINIPDWGDVWVQMSAPSGDDFFSVPTISYSNGSISWSFSAGGNTPPVAFRRSVELTYGVY